MTCVCLTASCFELHSPQFRRLSCFLSLVNVSAFNVNLTSLLRKLTHSEVRMQAFLDTSRALDASHQFSENFAFFPLAIASFALELVNDLQAHVSVAQMSLHGLRTVHE